MKSFQHKTRAFLHDLTRFDLLSVKTYPKPNSRRRIGYKCQHHTFPLMTATLAVIYRSFVIREGIWNTVWPPSCETLRQYIFTTSVIARNATIKIRQFLHRFGCCNALTVVVERSTTTVAIENIGRDGELKKTFGKPEHRGTELWEMND